MNIELTKDADKLICIIYKEYLRRREEGSSKAQAAEFGAAKTLGDFPQQDYSATLWELKSAGLIKKYIYDDFKLEDAGIIYMERRFPNGVSEVLEWLAKIKNAIPFA